MYNTIKTRNYDNDKSHAHETNQGKRHQRRVVVCPIASALRGNTLRGQHDFMLDSRIQTAFREERLGAGEEPLIDPCVHVAGFTVQGDGVQGRVYVLQGVDVDGGSFKDVERKSQPGDEGGDGDGDGRGHGTCEFERSGGGGVLGHCGVFGAVGG